MANATNEQLAAATHGYRQPDGRLDSIETSQASIAHLLLADAQVMQSRGALVTDRGKTGGRPSDEQKSAFQDTYEVQVVDTVVNGKSSFEYKLHANGEDMTLLRTDASKAGLDSAANQLQAMAAEMVKQMESDHLHPIRFSRPGEDVVKKRVLKNDGTFSDDGPMVKARMPRLDELYGIKAALQRSAPSNLLPDGSPVKIYFLADSFVEGLGLNVAAQVVDKNKQNAIYISPAGARLSDAAATEADLSDTEKAVAWDSRRPSIEADLVHEFAHVQQSKLGLLKRDNDLDDATAEKMGWVHLVDERQQIDTWMIKTKDRDQNNENILYRLDETNPFGMWVRCNAKGIDLNARGEPARGEPQTMSAGELVKKALYAPPTWYFPNPCEENAEVMKLFRLGEKSRANLLANSANLYFIAKRQDQAELDLHFHGSLIRDLDGSLVADSLEVEEKLQAFEASSTKSF